MRTMWLWSAALAVLAGCAGAGARSSNSQGAIAITVTQKGFEPAEVKVPKGAPVTLLVTRKTEKTCAKEFVMAEYGIRKNLPLNQPVEIVFTPNEAGELRYACGMDMIAGTVVVQ